MPERDRGAPGGTGPVRELPEEAGGHAELRPITESAGTRDEASDKNTTRAVGVVAKSGGAMKACGVCGSEKAFWSAHTGEEAQVVECRLKFSQALLIGAANADPSLIWNEHWQAALEAVTKVLKERNGNHEPKETKNGNITAARHSR